MGSVVFGQKMYAPITSNPPGSVCLTYGCCRCREESGSEGSGSGRGGGGGSVMVKLQLHDGDMDLGNSLLACVLHHLRTDGCIVGRWCHQAVPVRLVRERVARSRWVGG